MSSQQGSLRHRGAHQSHRRRRSSPSTSPARRRHPGTVSGRSPSDLVSLRFFVLSHIEEIERKLLSLESTNARCLFSGQDQGDTSAPESPCRSPPTEEADIYSSGSPSAGVSIPATPLSEELDLIVHEGLKRLHHLREEVSARLPDLEELKFHFPDFDWELPSISLVDLRARMPTMPNLSTVGSKLPDLDEYLPTLSERLRSLQSYLSSIPSISSAVNLGPLHDLLSSELIGDVQASAERAQTQTERTAAQVMSALKKSLHGRKLISYHDLPEKWRNNEWVYEGYRFIPLQEWPSLVLSMFTLHNETVNIHTHLIPLILFVPFLLYGWWRYTDINELPTTLFSIFASICLFCSVVWHTCTGSAHETLMEFTARLDYVGISWLICASLATFCWYGFSCRPFALAVYLSAILACGIAGSLLPFMQWFNARKYKKRRVAFFLCLAWTGLAPLIHMSLAHSFMDMWRYLRPILPSLVAYKIGVAFYAMHFPECCLSSGPHAKSNYHGGTDSIDSYPSVSSEIEFDHRNLDQTRHTHSKWRWIDYIGGGSHAVWHILIVVAVLSHRAGMPGLMVGPAGERCHAPRELGWAV